MKRYWLCYEKKKTGLTCSVGTRHLGHSSSDTRTYVVEYAVERARVRPKRKNVHMNALFTRPLTFSCFLNSLNMYFVFCHCFV